jgi:hypothetical protein
VCFALLSFYYSNAQSTDFKVPAGSSIAESIPFNDLYLYPAFIDGQVYFKNGNVVPAKLNYNHYFAHIQFIATKGDTLNLADAGTVRYIKIGTDTFYYDKMYLQQLKGNSAIKLAVQERIKVLDKQKIGGYGQPTSVSAIDSYDRYQNSNQLFKLALNETVLLSKEKKFYLGDQFNHFMLLNKKNIYKLFSPKEKEIANYLKERSINFDQQDDVSKVFEFLSQLK